MALTARLENPTPWDVKLDWDRGIKIRIPAFGNVDLGMQQMDDFRENKPGSEAVQETLHYHGLFLLDSDRPYDNQAVEALRYAREAKKAQHDAATRNITDRRAAQGIAPNEEALEETFRMQGLGTLKEKIATLENQIKALEEAIGPQRERSIREQLDPKRTIFVMDPPREFPSVAAMNFFLETDPEIKAKHEAFTQRAAAPVEPVATGAE
jgi:G:T/U-mismatch repair DNA glycosylase